MSDAAAGCNFFHFEGLNGKSGGGYEAVGGAGRTASSESLEHFSFLRLMALKFELFMCVRMVRARFLVGFACQYELRPGNRLTKLWENGLQGGAKEFR